jgi:hypothetical protein
MTNALVPIEAYDAQVMGVIRQIERGQTTPKPESIMAQNIRAIKATINGICLEGAISVLDAFGYKNDEFHHGGDKWKVHDLLDENYFPECQGRMANETPVFWFWGGPPNRLQWYKGTLQTLLEDRILYEITQRGADEVARWIGTDLRPVKSDVGC